MVGGHPGGYFLPFETSKSEKGASDRKSPPGRGPGGRQSGGATITHSTPYITTLYARKKIMRNYVVGGHTQTNYY